MRADRWRGGALRPLALFCYRFPFLVGAELPNEGDKAAVVVGLPADTALCGHHVRGLVAGLVGGL